MESRGIPESLGHGRSRRNGAKHYWNDVMRIAVTGSTGLLGSHLLVELLKHYPEISALRREGSLPRISLARQPNWIHGGLNDLSESALEGIDCLIHLAAHGVDPQKANWDDCFRCNVVESLALWRRAAKAGVKNFIICGSCFEYGATGDTCECISVDTPLRPTGPYHASKAAATMAASALSATETVKVWVLRPFHVYGLGESASRLYPQILKAAREGRDLDLTEGRQVRDFMRVEAAARMIHGYALLLTEEKREPFFRISNLGTGKPMSIRDFTTMIWKENAGTGQLNFGVIPYREAEVMRYVPEIDIAEHIAAANALSRVAEL
jgi:nucleoside-diphosphate-sugar epimerase